METVTENYNQSNCRAGKPSLNKYIYKPLLNLGLREQKDCKSPKIKESAVGLCLLKPSDAIPTVLQCDCPNVS